MAEDNNGDKSLLGSDESAPKRLPRRKGRPLADGGVAKRDEIIQAARELMQTVRPSKFTKAMVCNEANVDPSLLNYHFGDLDNLFVEILKQMIRELNERVVLALAKRANPEARLRRRINVLVDFVLDHPGFFELLVRNVYYGDSPWSAQALKDLTEPAHTAVSRVVARGRSDGVFRDDFDDRFLYIAIISLTDFISSGAPVLSILYPGRTPRAISRAYKRFVGDLIMHGISQANEAGAKPLPKDEEE